MYKLKQKLILDSQFKFAQEVGITDRYMSEVQNGRPCSKIVAYCITKRYNMNLEIEDLFVRV